MAVINLKFPRPYRYFLYASLALCWFSGLGYWLLRRFAKTEGEYGMQSHFLQYPFLQTHGFAAFVMLLCLGAVFSAHIPVTWKTKRERVLGISLLIQLLFSVLSAYSLYYLVGEDWHEWVGNAHALFGLLLPVMLCVHIYRGRRSRKVSPLRYS